MERVGLLAVVRRRGYTISVVNRQQIVVFRNAGCIYKSKQRSEFNRRQEENERRQRQVRESSNSQGDQRTGRGAERPRTAEAPGSRVYEHDWRWLTEPIR